VNCNRAIKLFDHLDRTNFPYCLAVASGKATLVNNIIWNSTPAFDLSGTAWGNLYVKVSYSDVQGGTNNSVRRADAILISGPGNIDVNPLFANAAATNFHILAGSPCIDSGTNAGLFLTNLTATITHDLDSVPRPLDGNGDHTNQFDMGAYEFLLASADSNGDGIPDGWMQRYGFNALDPNAHDANPDGDPHNNYQEYVADTNPTNAASFFHIGISNSLPAKVFFTSSSNRLYTLFYATNLSGIITWANVTGQTDVAGSGGVSVLSDPDASGDEKFYRVEVKAP
jgi:hypothetical protein